MSRSRSAALAVCIALVGPALVRTSGAQIMEPGRVHAIHVGASATGSERGGPSRSGLVEGSLPAAPVVAWRRALTSPLETAPVVAADGRVAVVLTGTGDVRLFDGVDGRELGSVDVGGPAASVAPAFLGDGTLVVLGTSGAATFVDRWGGVVARVPLGVRTADAIAPTATARGSVVLAVGRQILELDSRGRLLARGAIDDEIVAPLAIAPSRSGGHEVFAVTARGETWVARGALAPTKLGPLGGGSPGGVAVAPDGALWSVALGSVVRMEPHGRPTPWRANAASGVLAGRGPPALGADESVAFVGTDGSLVVLEPSGDVRHRVALDRAVAAATPTPGSSPSRPAGDDGPPLLIDGAGRIAFARSSGRVGVVAPDGRVAVASERLCASPLGIARTRSGFVVGCAEGYLIGIGEAGAGREIDAP